MTVLSLLVLSEGKEVENKARRRSRSVHWADDNELCAVQVGIDPEGHSQIELYPHAPQAPIYRKRVVAVTNRDKISSKQNPSRHIGACAASVCFAIVSVFLGGFALKFNFQCLERINTLNKNHPACLNGTSLTVNITREYTCFRHYNVLNTTACQDHFATLTEYPHSQLTASIIATGVALLITACLFYGACAEKRHSRQKTYVTRQDRMLPPHRFNELLSVTAAEEPQQSMSC